jgi:hypothetical protein
MRIDLPRIIHPPIVITVGNPAVGVTASYTIPDTDILFLHSVRFKVVNAAVAVNRYAALEIQDPTGIAIYSATQTNAFLTGETRDVYFNCIPNNSNYLSDTRRVMAIPYGIILPPKWLIQLLYQDMNAGDQISDIRICVSKFFGRA